MGEQYQTGDTVYAEFGKYGRIDVKAGLVTKVTPTGQITVDFTERHAGNQQAFVRRYKGGYEVTGDKWGRTHLIDYATYSRRLQDQKLNEARNAIRDAASKIAQTLPKEKSELRRMAEELSSLIDALPA